MASYDDTATVSGSVVSIENGADEVGAKSCVVTVRPTLSGTSSVSETQTGRNLFDKSAVIDNTWIVVNDTTTESVVGYRTSDYIHVKANTRYYVSTKSSNRTAYYDKNKNGIAYFSFSGGQSFNCLYDGYIRITIKNDIDLDTFIVNEGNTAITYEPYNGTTYTASLGRTIYGGTADIVNGEGKDTTRRYELDENDSWSAYSGASHSFWHNVATGENRPIKQTEASASICNYATYSSASPASAPDFSFLVQGGQRIVVTADSTIDTVEKFKTWLSSHNLVFVCPASTPTDFTFDGQEIDTMLGYNAFWSEQGDTELTYYKSGYGFTSVTVHKETPEGEPVEQTAYLHKVIYGGTADVIRGTCEPKNLFDLNNANLVDGYISTTSFNTENSKAKTIYIPINANTTYTVSKTAGQRFQIATSDVIPTNGATYTERVAQSGQQTSLTITSGSNDKYLWAWVFLQDTDTGTLADMLSSVQIEKGSSASEYVPGFTQFTFPPISMSTDEGENTLFANEGDSAITYRKAVD